MEEIIKSIKAYLYDRTNSPLLGTFIVSWLVLNYKFIMVISSSMGVDDKFKYVEDNIFTHYWDYILGGFFSPLIVTVIMIYGYPYPAKWVYEFSKKRQQVLNKIKQNIENEELLSVEKSRELKKEHIKLEIDHENEINRYKRELTILKDIIKDTHKLPDITEKNAESEEEMLRKLGVSKGQLVILDLISQGSGQRRGEQEILKLLEMKDFEIEYNITELLNMKMIRVPPLPPGKVAVKGTRPLILEHFGKEVLVKAADIVEELGDAKNIKENKV